MEVIKKVMKLCICCMEEHEVSLVRECEHTTFKGKSIEYYANYEYCEKCDEFNATEEMIVANDIALKDAYRAGMGLLTSEEIFTIRKKYGISQTDLSTLLSWGGKTITRYESHQIQDAAHDTILRKIDNDSEWFLKLLIQAREKLSVAAYEKYYRTAVQLFEEDQDSYLRKFIEASYAKYDASVSCCGGVKLNIDKLVDVIRYYSNSNKVHSLYKVKMMKLLWYADMLSFKRHGHSITGLAYCALPRGAVPVAHVSIMDLKGINYEEIDFDNGTAYHFKPSCDTTYSNLTLEDIDVIDTVIDVCGRDTKDQIVSRMHAERAYGETARGDVIQYQYAQDLSID